MNKSVLIIDDYPALLEVLPRIFENSGFSAKTVAAGADALEYLSENHVDLMVTDLDMPGMTGIELLRHVRELGFQFPIIFMSGNRAKFDPADIDKADAFIPKPIAIDELLNLVNNLIG